VAFHDSLGKRDTQNDTAAQGETASGPPPLTLHRRSVKQPQNARCACPHTDRAAKGAQGRSNRSTQSRQPIEPNHWRITERGRTITSRRRPDVHPSLQLKLYHVRSCVANDHLTARLYAPNVAGAAPLSGTAARLYAPNVAGAAPLSGAAAALTANIKKT